jgi:hypothetical protein
MKRPLFKRPKQFRRKPQQAVIPQPLRLETGQQSSVTTQVVKAPIPIVPTLYPEEPGGAVIVHNHITINVNSADFAKFSAQIGELLNHIDRSNEMSPEVRAKAIGEITAGMAIAKSPKPDRDLIRLLLINPLKWIAEKAGSALISKLATDALALLLKITGLL